MKTLLIFLQIYLLMCGVFDADADEVRSVMEGDSITLHTDLTQIQGIIEILWRFGEKLSTIAQIDGNVISYEDIKRFKDRLQLNQAGSLTITNTRTNHSGLYEAEIRHKTGTSNQKFRVTVYESPSVIAGAEAEMKLMSVKEGDPVTLDVPQIQGDELIVWRFGDEEKLIAKHDLEAKSSPLYYETDERFRDRLKLNDQTGSLTITNTRTTDSGLYTVKISSNKQILYKRFTVTVSAVPDSGLSGGAKAGIVVGVLLLVAAAVAAGVMYYLRPRITNLPSVTWSVTEGDDVTINPETEIQRGDEIQWLFGYEEQTVLTEIKNTKVTKYDGTDWRFRDGLELNEETGTLTIKNITAEHTEFYTLKITRGREKINKKIYIFVEEREITVMEGESVTLKPAREIKKDDLIRCLFGDEEQQTGIAELKVKTGEILTRDDVADERFRDRLQLNKTTGSLTITNTRTEHSGVYKLEIRSSSGFSEQTFIVTVRDKVEEKFLNKGDSVTLKPDTEIQRDDLILWMFGDQDKVIAQMKGGTVDIYDDVNTRFRGRLKLDEKTGSLTITKIEAKHTGPYKLMISSSREILYKKFKVSIQSRFVAVAAGESVRLYTGLTEIQRDDEIQWRFRYKNSLIAEIKGGTGVTHDGPDKRFRDRLELDEKTGDLIIKKSTDQHTGCYELKISSSEGKTNRTYTVTIKERFVEVTAGESVHLNTNLTEIHTDDEIEWRFGKENSLIAEIKRGTGETRDVSDERFRDRLELNKKTGDLTIKNSTAKHTGPYKLKISSSEGNTNRTYRVYITAREKSLLKEKTDSRGNRVNESATVVMPLLNGDDLDVVNEEEGTSSL